MGLTGLEGNWGGGAGDEMGGVGSLPHAILPCYESVLTGSGMLAGIWMTSGSNDSESCYWE